MLYGLVRPRSNFSLPIGFMVWLTSILFSLHCSTLVFVLSKNGCFAIFSKCSLGSSDSKSFVLIWHRMTFCSLWLISGFHFGHLHKYMYVDSFMQIIYHQANQHIAPEQTTIIGYQTNYQIPLACPPKYVSEHQQWTWFHTFKLVHKT